jgi:hypothetical protein
MLTAVLALLPELSAESFKLEFDSIQRLTPAPAKRM